MDSIEYEALRRVREMQRGQSQNQNLNQGNNPNKSGSQAHSPPKREKEHTPEPVQKTADIPQAHGVPPVQTLPTQNHSSDLAGSLFEDKEKLLILALILILTGEESHDPALILALLYLII